MSLPVTFHRAAITSDLAGVFWQPSAMEHYFFRIAGFVGWVRRVYAVPNITKPVTFKAVGLRDETANPTYEKTGVTGY